MHSRWNTICWFKLPVRVNVVLLGVRALLLFTPSGISSIRVGSQSSCNLRPCQFCHLTDKWKTYGWNPWYESHKRELKSNHYSFVRNEEESIDNWPLWCAGQRLLYTALPQPVDSSASSLSAGDPPKSLFELLPSPPAVLYEPKQNKYWHYIHTRTKRKHFHLSIFLVGVSQMINNVCVQVCVAVYPGQFLPVFLHL